MIPFNHTSGQKLCLMTKRQWWSHFQGGWTSKFLSVGVWGGVECQCVDVMENYAGSTELHTERNRKQECLHRRDEKWKSGFREGWKLFVNFNANLQMSQHLQKFWFVARFISKGGLAMTGASEILALPKLALSPPPTPQSWHTGGFCDKKCVKSGSQKQEKWENLFCPSL